LLSLM